MYCGISIQPEELFFRTLTSSFKFPVLKIGSKDSVPGRCLNTVLLSAMCFARQGPVHTEFHRHTNIIISLVKSCLGT